MTETIQTKYAMQNVHLWFTLIIAGACAACLLSCATAPQPPQAQIINEPFGFTKDGTPVRLFTLRNSKGLEARICNYGGIIVSFKGPDRHGKPGDVVLGYDNLDAYITNNPFFGCLVGRYGNRIAKAKFTLDGKEYSLAANNGLNSLHGGLKGFDKVVWEPSIRTGP